MGRGLFRLVQWNVRKETALRGVRSPWAGASFRQVKAFSLEVSEELKSELPGHGCHETLSSTSGRDDLVSAVDSVLGSGSGEWEQERDHHLRGSTQLCSGTGTDQ